MSHMRYWAMSVATALAGGLLAIDRFAFAPTHAVWIGFGVATAAGFFSLGATGVALVRQNHELSGLSAASALVAGWTIVATRVFNASSGLWLAFSGGLALLLLSLRALALREITIERILHALELNGEREPAPVGQGRAVGASPVHRPRDGLPISGTMRSWMYWLAHTGVALVGAFVVFATFAWWPGASLQFSPRWLTFGVGVLAALLAVLALLERALAACNDYEPAAQLAAIVITALSAAVGIVLIVLMVGNVSHARWWAFGLGDGMVGVSLLALVIHELSSERLRHALFGLGDGMVGVSLLALIIHELSSERARHELEIAEPSNTTQAEAFDAR